MAQPPNRIFVVSEAVAVNLSASNVHISNSAGRRDAPSAPAASPVQHVPQKPSTSALPVAPTFIVNTNSSIPTMTLPAFNQQVQDTALLREITTNAVNNALAALKADKPTEAATALRSALGLADRLVTANAALLTANARQSNEFFGYSINDPLGGADAGTVRNSGGYDLNNP